MVIFLILSCFYTYRPELFYTESSTHHLSQFWTKGPLPLTQGYDLFLSSPQGAQLPSSVPLTCPHLSASSLSDTRYSSSPCTTLSTLDWKSVISPESPGDDSLFSQVSDTVFFLVQSLCCVRLFATPWTAARQASLSFTISRSLLKLMSTESVTPSNYLGLCHPLLLLPSLFPSIRVFFLSSITAFFLSRLFGYFYKLTFCS